jgi:two-component system NarL family response regulator
LGIEACRQIKQQHPELPILVLTSRSQNSLIARLIEVGSQGYCLKGIAAEALVLAIRSVAAGASWWDKMQRQRFVLPLNAIRPTLTHQDLSMG